MRRALPMGVFAVGVVGVLVSAVPARALVVALPAGPARAVQADAVVIGRVIALEDKDVQVNNVTYRIAVVNVAETLKGKKEQMVRVGFIPPANAANPGGLIRPAIARFNPQYSVGQDGLFFLTKGPEGKFFTTPGFGTFVPSQQANFNQEVEQAKLGVKISDNPTKYLKSENADERTFAATLLIQTYRAPRINAKQEPIDAEESKLILKALVGADWDGRKPGAVHPYQLFNQLGITAKDGWTPPKNVRDFREIQKAAREWLDKNADTYRIEKHVGGQPVGAPGTGVRPIGPIQIQPLPGGIQILPVQPQAPAVPPPPAPPDKKKKKKN